ncbi:MULTISPECIES: BlaI/MecI/CopY family transcriptional regulator [unclassified Lysobacter]|uniref:BlaI/MecI/CopY family transcriptional regulator n=1 Tax=unclassified Lysobacter TaxID=2635362 RepID=UPI000710DED5|nr:MULTISPECIES: BlaI/MecI/CopY family transcriptional regulator [unclassified Lysobacter]KRD34689.1 MarR family transcriptional regulator [Lysobacter sp. Root916]KRD77067.1 MarR family transcriptional regulator [Lysobacter sp. Root983]
MARPTAQSVTEAEQAILEVLWELGEASVREVANALARQKPVAYTTVLTMLGILHKKELVTFRQEGRAFIYRPALTKADVRERALSHLMTQLFDGSPEALALHLIENHDVDPGKIAALRDKVRAARKQEKAR